MEWVAQSRIQKSLDPDCVFIMYFTDDILQINLSNLSKEYQKKHIEPNLSVYALSFLHQITPTLVKWCEKYNIQYVEMKFRFKTEKEIHKVTRAIHAKKVDREAQDYLENKST